ncbi:MAG: hypothetical protein D6705_09045 [Deltaproteobacteria bacterium]|nr:MAG: hypothetical protein D6705_09045 [Deltaproteobacteria bacterium]
MTDEASLERSLCEGARWEDTLAACEALLDKEVQATSGVSGMAVRSGYKVVRALRPGIVRELLTMLVPEFCRALEPMYAEARSRGGDVPAAFEAILRERPDAVAEALLSVTDARAERAKNKVLRKTYARLRGGAKQHVMAAVPNLARTLRDLLAIPDDA